MRLSTIKAYYVGKDPTYDAYRIAIWSTIEIDMAIITSSIPAIKPLFLAIVRWVLNKVGWGKISR